MAAVEWIATELLGIFFLVLAGVYVYYKYVIFNFWRKKGVFNPEPFVPTGNLTRVVLAKTSIGEYFEECYSKYKSHGFFGLYTFFKPNLVVTDPELVRFVLTKDFGSFQDRGMYYNEDVDPLSGHLFFLPGKKWRNLRVKLTPTFTSGKIKQMFDTMKETGDQLTRHLESKAEQRTNIEIKEIFSRYATDIIVSIAFGVNCNTLNNENNEFRYWGKKVFDPRPITNAMAIFTPKVMDVFKIPFTDRGVEKFFLDAFTNMVEQRQKHKIVRRDFMNLLLQLMEHGYVAPDDEKDDTKNGLETSPTKLTLQESAAQAFVFYLAGFETSSMTITYCIYELALQPHLQDKLREEIDASLKKHGGMTYNSLNEMTYLHKVISETLRKYPPLPMLNRVCTKKVDIPNSKVTIPEGTLVTIPVLGLHKDPSLYPDPEKFDPERFNEENIAARHSYVYLPFGEGPRVCIGMRFGLIQTKVGIVSALAKYKFREGPDTQIPIKFCPGNFALTPKDGVNLIIEPR